MPHELTGQRSGDERFGIVVSNYNESITSKLFSGAVETLQAAGVSDNAIDVVRVPGAFEIPLAALTMAQSGKYSAVLCLGAVIRGETTHDQHINRSVSLGLMEASLSTGVPVLFGVLTCDSLEQAIHRAGGQAGNKGVECAEAALQMAALMRRLGAGE
jgi:6,7-dimethyl-8-ribityllumazine synthase